jgi:glutamyl-tRNA synthetase
MSLKPEQILKMTDHELAVLVAPLLVDSGLTSKYWLETRWVYLRQVVGLLKPHVRQLSDFVDLGGYFFFFNHRYDERAQAELFTPEAAGPLELLVERFVALPDFDRQAVDRALTQLAEENGVEKAKLTKLTRLAVSGMTVGPELSEMLVVLSQPVVVERLKKAVDYIRATHKL